MLNFKSLILLSMILKKLNITDYYQILDIKSKKSDKFNNIELERISDKKLKEERINELKKEKENSLTFDIMFFLAENYHLAEEEIKEFLLLNSKKTIENIDMLEIDEIINIVKDVFKDGMPKIILDKVDEFKKKI